MAIKEIYDEINDVTVTMVEGTVQQISFKEIPGGSDKFGNTHRAGIRVDDDWVNNVNIKVNEGFDPKVRFNAGTKSSPKYETLEVGDVVKIVVQPSDYNGKTYYNSGVSKIRLVKKGSGVSQQPQGGSQKGYTPQKRDNSGQSIGHSINVAMNVLGDLSDPQAIIKAAKKAHDLTTKLKEEYAVKNPDMSEYDLGGMVGQSVLSASHYADSVEDIEDIARQTLDVVVPAVSEYVKGTKEAPKTEKKTTAKKTVAKKTTKKAEPTPSRVDDEDIPEDAFLDDIDELPF